MTEQVCAFCRRTGKNGARWVLKIGHDRHPVHRPCGRKLADHAPKGVKTAIFPTKELAAELRAERFWKQKFSEAKAARAQHA